MKLIGFYFSAFAGTSPSNDIKISRITTTFKINPCERKSGTVRSRVVFCCLLLHRVGNGVAVIFKLDHAGGS